MTGDKVDKATMTYGNREDIWVANKVRMLMRDDLDHEFVCVGARDRIMYLSQEVDRLTTDNAVLTAENTRIFAMVDAREQTIAELTALCDGYRGERDALGEAIGRVVVSAGVANNMAMTGPMLILMLQALEEDHKRKRLPDALTRARAEVLEEAAKIAETVYAKEEMTIRGTGYDIAAHIRAAKGEQ